jgi:hypothetical protein
LTSLIVQNGLRCGFLNPSWALTRANPLVTNRAWRCAVAGQSVARKRRKCTSNPN